MAPPTQSENDDEQTLLPDDHAYNAFHEKPPPYSNTPQTALSQMRNQLSKIFSTRMIVLAFLCFFILGIAFGNLYYRFAPIRTLTNPCGTTPDEAIALGCKFDVINFSWQRPECFFPEIHERYWQKVNEHGPLRLYADAEYKEVLPTDIEVYKRTPKIWSEHHFHLVHCMYCYEVMHRAVIEGRPAVEPISEWNHTMHCAKTGALQEWEVQDTQIDMSYYKCVDVRRG